MTKLFIVSYQPTHHVMHNFNPAEGRRVRVVDPNKYPDSSMAITIRTILGTVPKNLSIVGFINEGKHQALVIAAPDSMQASDLHLGVSADFLLLDKKITEVGAQHSLSSLVSTLSSSLVQSVQTLVPGLVGESQQATATSVPAQANPITDADELRSMKCCSVALKTFALEEVKTKKSQEKVELFSRQLERFKTVFDELYAPLNNPLEATIAFSKVVLAHWGLFLDQRAAVGYYGELFALKKLMTNEVNNSCVPRFCDVSTVQNDANPTASVAMIFTLHTVHDVNREYQASIIAKHLLAALDGFHNGNVTYRIAHDDADSLGVRLIVKFTAYTNSPLSTLDEEIREILAQSFLSRLVSLVSMTFINQPIGKNRSHSFAMFDQQLVAFIDDMSTAVLQSTATGSASKHKPKITLKDLAESFKCHFSDVALIIAPKNYDNFVQISKNYCEVISEANLFPASYAQLAWLMMITVINMCEDDNVVLNEFIIRQIRSFKTENPHYKLALVVCGLLSFLQSPDKKPKINLVRLAQLITIVQSITVVDATLLAKVTSALSSICEKITTDAESKDRHLYSKLLNLGKGINPARAEYAKIFTDIINFAKTNKRDELLAAAVDALAQIDESQLRDVVTPTSSQSLAALFRDQSLAIPADRRTTVLELLTPPATKPVVADKAKAQAKGSAKSKSRPAAKKPQNVSQAPVVATLTENTKATLINKSDAENLVDRLETYVFPRKKYVCAVESENVILVTTTHNDMSEESISRLERLGLKKIESEKESTVRFLIDNPEFSDLKWRAHFKSVTEKAAPRFHLSEKKSVKPAAIVNQDDDEPAPQSRFVSLKGEELLRSVIAQFLKCDLRDVGKEWTEEFMFDKENRQSSNFRFAIKNAESGCNIKNKNRLNADTVVEALIAAFGGEEFGDFYPRSENQTDSRLPDVFVIDRQTLIAALENPAQYQDVADRFVELFDAIETPNRGVIRSVISTIPRYVPQATSTIVRTQFDFAMWKNRFSHVAQEVIYGEGISFHLGIIKNLLTKFDQSTDETYRKRIFRLYALHSFSVINLIFECERTSDSPMKTYLNSLRQSIRHTLDQLNFEKLLPNTRHFFMALYGISLAPNFTHLNSNDSLIENSLRFFESLIASLDKSVDINSQRDKAEFDYLQELITHESDPLTNHDIAVSCCVIHQSSPSNSAVGKLIAAVSGFIGHPIEAIAKHSEKGRYDFDKALNTVIEPLTTRLTPVIAIAPMK